VLIIKCKSAEILQVFTSLNNRWLIELLKKTDEMNFEGLLKYFVPKEKKFYAMFNQAAENTIEASAALEKLFNSPSADDRKSMI